LCDGSPKQREEVRKSHTLFSHLGARSETVFFEQNPTRSSNLAANNLIDFSPNIFYYHTAENAVPSVPVASTQ
jgi:hypothetical protein